MKTDAEDPRIQSKIDEMAGQAIHFSDEELAGRFVGLLIMDEGNLNKYQRTCETMIRIVRSIERQKRENDR